MVTKEIIFDENDIYSMCEDVVVEHEETATIIFYLDIRPSESLKLMSNTYKCKLFARYLKVIFSDSSIFKITTDSWYRVFFDFPIDAITPKTLKLSLQEICKLKIPDSKSTRRFINYIQTSKLEITYPGIFANYCHGLSYKANRFIDSIYKKTD